MTLPTNQNAYLVASGTGTIFPTVVFDRAPDSTDFAYQPTQRWINTSNGNEEWFLLGFTSSDGVVAPNWVLLSSAEEGLQTLTGNDGTPVPVDANENINLLGGALSSTGTSSTGLWLQGSPSAHSLTVQAAPITINGGTGINTSGSSPTYLGQSSTVNLTTPVTVPNGGTGDTSFTAYMPVCGGTTSTGPLQSVSTGGASAGDVLTYNSSSSLPTWQANPSGGIDAVNVQVFVYTGSTQTYTPTAGMAYCIVEVLGGGGAGGGSAGTGSNYLSTGAGGGAGEYARGLFTASSIGASQTVTIGAAGAGVSASAGGNGGTTSVGSLITAYPGQGGGISPTFQTSGVAYAGLGGTGGTGGSAGSSFRTAGGAGSAGSYLAVTPGGIGSNIAGQGANSQYGAGGIQLQASSAGANAFGYGAGGSGATSNSMMGPYPGGNGSAGIVIITEYIT